MSDILSRTALFVSTKSGENQQWKNHMATQRILQSAMDESIGKSVLKDGGVDIVPCSNFLSKLHSGKIPK